MRRSPARDTGYGLVLQRNFVTARIVTVDVMQAASQLLAQLTGPCTYSAW